MRWGKYKKKKIKPVAKLHDEKGKINGGENKSCVIKKKKQVPIETKKKFLYRIELFFKKNDG